MFRGLNSFTNIGIPKPSPHSLIHLPLKTRFCLLFHPWRLPTVYACLFIAIPQALTPPHPSPHIFLSPTVSLSSISWSHRSAQVRTRVVLSRSGFTHSRYYRQTPVSWADSHLDRAVSRLADNDGRCPPCQAPNPQIKGPHQAWSRLDGADILLAQVILLDYYLPVSFVSHIFGPLLHTHAPRYHRMFVEYSNSFPQLFLLSPISLPITSSSELWIMI